MSDKDNPFFMLFLEKRECFHTRVYRIYIGFCPFRAVFVMNLDYSALHYVNAKALSEQLAE
ncbi:hypothetical protein CFS9_40060 [Flavobacterium sp. CFS9]|uniref:Uncharacterized protein n=1 Tax=Flavobacterium sp. CFS9 TaxID=3143118 RepID=A0AAT9H7C9_9FLAO